MTTRTFAEAKKFCSLFGADLPNLDTEEEFDVTVDHYNDIGDLWIDLLNVWLVHNANMDGKAFWGNGAPFQYRNSYMRNMDNNDPGMCFRYWRLKKRLGLG